MVAVGSGMDGLFSAEVYEEYIVPHVLELFTLHDLPVRQLLLQYLPHYVQLIPKDVLKSDVVSRSYNNDSGEEPLWCCRCIICVWVIIRHGNLSTCYQSTCILS